MGNLLRQLKMGLASPELFIRSFALGHVSRDLAKADEFTFGVSKCGNYDVGPKSRTVLGYPPAFLLVTPLLRRNAELACWLSRLDVLRDIETREGVSNYFFRPVPFEPLGAGVPRGDRAIRR